MYSPRRELGARFQAASVAENYRHRPPYSDEVYALLEELLEGRSPRVLDAGAGPGKIARELVARGFSVDAVEASEEMIRVGRREPGGDDEQLRWIHATIEDAPLTPGYGIAVAGASFHWFDADVVLPRLADHLEEDGLLVVLDGDGASNAPWRDAEQPVFQDFVSRLEGRRVEWEPKEPEEVRVLAHPAFEFVGRRVTAPATFRQRVEDYIACQHSRASFSHDVMGEEIAREFDDAMRVALAPHEKDGWITYDRRTTVEWGRPTR